jgi:hypothetical protein
MNGCGQPGACPACGAPNGCRLETGEAYKGACWCQSVELSPDARRRIEQEVAAERCLCEACLRRFADADGQPQPPVGPRA